MKKVELLDNRIVDVYDFDVVTNRELPYYNKGKRFARCPNCGSAVQIIGGDDDTQSRTLPNAHAQHRISPVVSFPLANYKHCPDYEPNHGNWQGLYNQNSAHVKNQKLETYIQNNASQIAREMSDLTGVNFYPTNNLYLDTIESFENNNGLYSSTFIPAFVSRQILEISSPVDFKPYTINKQSIINKIKKSSLKNDLKNNQLFHRNVRFVVVKDNLNSPTQLIVKLLFSSSELELYRFTANPF